MKNWYYYILVFILWFLYVAIAFTSRDTDTNEILGLTQFQLDLLTITLIVPYLLIWLIATYGVVHLQNYINTIKNDPDGKALSYISRGLFLLISMLIISTLVSSISAAFIQDSNANHMVLILTNYIYVFFPLGAFFFVYQGSQKLISNIKGKKPSVKQLLIVFATLAVFSVMYISLVFTNSDRQVSSVGSLNASYYIPDYLIILTIIIPSIIAWSLGLFGVTQMYRYMKEVKGLIYKKALHNFVVGIGIVVIGSIVIQTVLSIGTTRLLQSGLGGILALLYLFLVVQAAGFIFIALGSKKLIKIEELDL